MLICFGGVQCTVDAGRQVGGCYLLGEQPSRNSVNRIRSCYMYSDQTPLQRSGNVPTMFLQRFHNVTTSHYADGRLNKNKQLGGDVFGNFCSNNTYSDHNFIIVDTKIINIQFEYYIIINVGKWRVYVRSTVRLDVVWVSHCNGLLFNLNSM